MIPRDDITGLILAGGRGSRMGGTDKGLQPLRGAPMALHTLRRLAPQTGSVLISANRNLAAYAAFGMPVVTDPASDPASEPAPEFAGPLAGMLAGLRQCRTGWLLTAPCDSPFLPADLAARLAAAVEAQGAEMAIPVTVDAAGRRQTQPVFCLMPAAALDSLAAYLAGGRRKIETWAASHRLAEVLFEDAGAFANINTLDELRALEAR
ncbi:molybdenum cofactor guanylyltransferase MobA [Cupriavidus sp. 30B13]|uniref:molybdenum cofactor guanylyltransferase MobA n=1 Tax=Cupriavidus sp. 30B13 TaxID=3384241 RepID=UPI003B9160A6